MNPISVCKMLKHETYENTFEILIEKNGENGHRTTAIQTSKWDFYDEI